jgi:hypothetical protein
MKLILKIATSVGAVLLIAHPASAQSAVGNLTCFKITDPMPRAKFQATLGSDAGSLHCIFKAPAKRACVATSGTVVTPAPPDMANASPVSASFLCYQAKCSAPGHGAAQVGDALGQRAVAFLVPQSLCLAASVGTVTTTTTVGGETTTTVPIGCRFANGECTGSCGSGMQCGAVAGTASCGCLSVPCGQADAPECSGFCSEPSEACIFSVTGCSCARIP